MCNYLAHNGTITLSGNGAGCNSSADLISSCTATSISTNEIPDIVIHLIGKQLVIKSDKPIRNFILRNVSGMEILQSKNNCVTMDLKDIQEGVYFVDVSIENQNIVKKIVLSK